MSDSHVAPLEDEPKSPMWLPALGAALFVSVGLWWAVTPSTAPIVADEAASASAAAAPTPPPQPAPTAPPTQIARPTASARPALSAGQIDPKVEEKLKRLHDQIQLKPAGGGRHP
jgi:hypothetical protein